MPNITPWTPGQLDAFRYSSNGDDARWLATIEDREARRRRAVEWIAEKMKYGDGHSERCRIAPDGYPGCKCSLYDRVKRGRDVIAENADLLKGESP